MISSNVSSVASIDQFASTLALFAFFLNIDSFMETCKQASKQHNYKNKSKTFHTNTNATTHTLIKKDFTRARLLVDFRQSPVMTRADGCLRHFCIMLRAA